MRQYSTGAATSDCLSPTQQAQIEAVVSFKVLEHRVRNLENRQGALTFAGLLAGLATYVLVKDVMRSKERKLEAIQRDMDAMPERMLRSRGCS